MAGSVNPTDIGRFGHRFQVRVGNSAATPTELVCSRVQSIDNSITQDTAVYYELGTIDPVGYSSDAPEHRVVLTENVHATDLDLLLAGKIIASDTTWHLGNYNVGNGPYSVYVLERDNSGTVQGELAFTGGALTEIQWQWRMGQPIDARYTFQLSNGKHYIPGQTVHPTWGAQSTTDPGGIRIKDARLYLGGSTEAYKMYRLQGFTLRVAWRTTVVREAGNRQVVGILAEPPTTNLDCDIAFADHQPDDQLYTLAGSGFYYDYQNYAVNTVNAIRIFDPTAAEGSTVLRAWKLDKLVTTNASPAIASVRGLSTKRYSLVVSGVVTTGTGGVNLFKGEIV